MCANPARKSSAAPRTAAASGATSRDDSPMGRGIDDMAQILALRPPLRGVGAPRPARKALMDEVEHRTHPRQAMALLRIDREHLQVLGRVEIREKLHQPSVAKRA